MAHPKARRGFTLIELVIVIAVIAILAALLVPVILNQVERARVAAEHRSIVELAKAMQRFKNDTGSWPLAGGYWDMQNQIEPGPFQANDTALFAIPTVPPPGSATNLVQCSTLNVGSNCWGGPYAAQLASGDSGGLNPAFVDAWGNPRMVAMINPVGASGGGGTPSAPNGFVVVYSLGPDGMDETGCYGAKQAPGCTRNLDAMAKGESSMATSDDIIQVAGSAI